MSAAEQPNESDRNGGGAQPSRHIDYETAQLDRLARSWLDVQQTRKALTQRELDDRIIASFLKGEQALSRELSKVLRHHVIWPWLSQFPGLGGAHTALVIGRIGDPRRFPGQRCTEGHYLPPLYAVGAPCPISEPHPESENRTGDGASVDAPATDWQVESEGDRGCRGVMLAPRETTGVRSLWHWAGLHAIDGKAPRKRKGVQADWEPRVRSSVMQPGGIAEQIVRLNVPYYADLYREAKARLILRVPDRLGESDVRPGDVNTLRVSEVSAESERITGDANYLRAAAHEGESEVRDGRPLRLFEADRIARKVAAKAFLGDLLIEWKGLCA